MGKKIKNIERGGEKNQEDWGRKSRGGGEENQDSCNYIHACLAFKCFGCLIAVFLDVKGAFDRVWITGVHYKLLHSGLPSHLVRIVANFLADRTMVVKLNNSYSREISLKAGTPQGGVLSPEIYNFYSDDILQGIPVEVEGSQYADDLGCWGFGKN